MIDKPKLDTKKPVGNGITAPAYAGKETVIIPVPSISLGYSSPMPSNDSGPNLSAKWKNGAPSVPEAGQNQYM